MGRFIDFGQAIAQLKAGQRVRRANWNGKGMWLKLQMPDEHSKMTLPYIYIEYPAGHPAYPDGSRVPWSPSQTDILWEDWVVLDAQPSPEDDPTILSAGLNENGNEIIVRNPAFVKVVEG